ncbi:MAG: isocitrate/isopropylmalate dehydrogenase family protein [Candidatus Bathyarchaeia archaeon]|nr:isocitrate/isopropylmalate dehydrogenase family protein [Candidatus Bathyarchaeota archaeon]
MKRLRIALIPGDGIGPEQTEATIAVLEAVQQRFGFDIDFVKVEAGDECYRKTGEALPKDTIEAIKNTDAILKGPVGEMARDVVVRLRLMFKLYANIRPAKSYPGIECLRPDIDLVIVRENTEDLYKGIEFTLDESAIAIRVITASGSRDIADYAFKLARVRNRKRRVTIVHKANVMRVTDGLFREVCFNVSRRYPDIDVNELYVDAAAMNLIRKPHEFDVLVTTNMFGDILSDEAAQLVGGLGVAPSANIGRDFALFEPVHGSAPDIAGKQIANPCSMILSSKMMLEYFGEKMGLNKYFEAAEKIEYGFIKALKSGITTPDLGGRSKTLEVGRAIAQTIIEGVQ